MLRVVAGELAECLLILTVLAGVVVGVGLYITLWMVMLPATLARGLRSFTAANLGETAIAAEPLFATTRPRSGARF